MTSPHVTWSEAKAMLTVVLQQLEDAGHSRSRLQAVLMDLARRGWEWSRL